MAEALKPLLLLLNHYRSPRLYFCDCICRLQSRFEALRSRFRDFVVKYIIDDDHHHHHHDHDDHDNDDKDDYSCNSVNFKVRTSRFFMELDINYI